VGLALPQNPSAMQMDFHVMLGSSTRPILAPGPYWPQNPSAMQMDFPIPWPSRHKPGDQSTIKMGCEEK